MRRKSYSVCLTQDLSMSSIFAQQPFWCVYQIYPCAPLLFCHTSGAGEVGLLNQFYFEALKIPIVLETVLNICQYFSIQFVKC